jgi:hypothetical protein
MIIPIYLKKEIFQFLVDRFKADPDTPILIETVMANFPDVSHIICHHALSTLSDEGFIKYFSIHFFDEYTHEHSYSGKVMKAYNSDELLSPKVIKKAYTLREIEAAMNKTPKLGRNGFSKYEDRFMENISTVDVNEFWVNLFGKSLYNEYKNSRND